MKNNLDKKLKLKDLEKALLKNSIEIGDLYGQKIMFNSDISCEKIFYAGKNIAKCVFKDDGDYLDGLSSILVFCFAVKSMTNISIKEDEDGNLDIDFVYRLMNSEIGKTLEEKFRTTPSFLLLSNEVKNQVNYRKEIYLRKLYSNKSLENLDKVINQIYKLVQKISSLSDQYKDIFSQDVLDKITSFIKDINSNKYVSN